MTELIIEFPMCVVNAYNGAGNVDETLDDNITYIIGRHFHEYDIEFSIQSMNLVPPTPEVNDELVRYRVTIHSDDAEECPKRVLAELKADGFERGCTIKTMAGGLLHADEYTADIQVRRTLGKKRRKA